MLLSVLANAECELQDWLPSAPGQLQRVTIQFPESLVQRKPRPEAPWCCNPALLHGHRQSASPGSGELFHCRGDVARL